MADETLAIVDNRTGREYTVPIVDGTIRATDLRQISATEGDGGLTSYDPAFLNTANCRSAITYIDGDAGILRYRGYPIEQLAEEASFLETAYLLLEGELPTADQLAVWEDEVRVHTYVHTNLIKFLEGFRYDAHPMGMLLGAVGALSTFYPDAKDIVDPVNRRLQQVRLLAKMPTLAAFAFRHSRGLPYVYPRNDLDYVGNFVNMTFEIGGKHEPNPVLQRSLEILLVLHADHEQNCSTSAVRGVGSSQVDPFSAVSAGIAALYGPLHGGANEAVLRMLDDIGSTANIPAFIESVKAGKGRLMGFGHRVYKSYDPRATLIKRVADDVFAQTGLNPKLEIALELERIALEDEYFVSRKLYPNVDFYSGLIYQAMGYPTDYFTVLFALGRLPGLDCSVGRDAHRPRAEDRAAAAGLHRRGAPRLRADLRQVGPPHRGKRQQARDADRGEGDAPVAGEGERSPGERRSDEEQQDRERVDERHRGGGCVGSQGLRRTEDDRERQACAQPGEQRCQRVHAEGQREREEQGGDASAHERRRERRPRPARACGSSAARRRCASRSLRGARARRPQRPCPVPCRAARTTARSSPLRGSSPRSSPRGSAREA